MPTWFCTECDAWNGIYDDYCASCGKYGSRSRSITIISEGAHGGNAAMTHRCQAYSSDNASISYSSRPSSYIEVFYCCECSTGPALVKNNPQCPNADCQHPRCENCTTELLPLMPRGSRCCLNRRLKGGRKLEIINVGKFGTF